MRTICPRANQLVRVGRGLKRKITDGDKLAGRHGNKGNSKIPPIEDMPFLEDGTPCGRYPEPAGRAWSYEHCQVLEVHTRLAG